MKNCPNCGHENLEDARFCEECGHPFTSESVETSEIFTEEEQQPQPKNDRFCPNCGESVPKDADFCPNCGQRLTAAVGPAPTAKKPLSKKQKIGISTGLVLIVLLVGGFMFGRHYYSYPQQLSRLERTFKTQDPEKMAEVITSEDSNYKVSAANLKNLSATIKKAATKQILLIFWRT